LFIGNVLSIALTEYVVALKPVFTAGSVVIISGDNTGLNHCTVYGEVPPVNVKLIDPEFVFEQSPVTDML
jgi:hypothetical protein